MANTQQRKKYFISEHLHRQVFHGGIGNVDAEKILVQQGYTQLFFPAHYDFSFWGKLKRLTFLFKCWLTIPANAIVVFQFPVLATMNKLLLKWLGSKRVTRICFIADIDGIKDGDEQLLQKEINELKTYSRFIVHNQKMKAWLLEINPGAIVSEIEFFDFLAQPFICERQNEPVVTFAGNLAKSPFVQQLGRLYKPESPLKFLLYGPGHTDQLIKQPNVEFKGVHVPYTLVSLIHGSFGLVWDGDSIDDTTSSSLGRYMAYISHHKLSLYIVARMPVITAASAASAYLVEKYGIGFTVNNLWEIEDRILSIDDASYQNMVDNTRVLANRIMTGQGLITALQAHEQQLK